MIDIAHLSTNITACIAYVMISMGGQFVDFFGFGGRTVGAGVDADARFLAGCRFGDDTFVIAVFSRIPLGQ